MKLLDKIKSYCKEHKRDIIKYSKIVILLICLVVMLFSCATDVFAADMSPSVTSDSSTFALPDNYNIIPVGTYTIRSNELDFDTYPVSDGLYSFRCICSFGATLNSEGVYTVQDTLESTTCVVSSGIMQFYATPYSFSYYYNDSIYGWNAFLYSAFNNSPSDVNISFVPVNFIPIFSVPTEQNVGYEFGAFFHNNFVLVDDSSAGECPTIEELLTNYPDAYMSSLLIDTKPQWFNQNNQDWLDAGFGAGFTAGYDEGVADTTEQLDGTFLGDLVGGTLDAIDQLVLYSDNGITITMLTAIRSVFAALFVMWILKLIAGG